MQGPNFILGLGAQKAGTTWLFDYLDAHPDCVMGPFKEMNFFKAPGTGKRGRRDGGARPMKTPAWRMSKRLDEDADARMAAELDVQLIRHRPSHYAQVYHEIARTHPGLRLMGDISPNYAALRPAGLRAMRDYLADMGYPVKVVFLLRDPVRRCFSAARMAERGQGAFGKKILRQGKDPAVFTAAQFPAYARKPICAAHTRYEVIIQHLEKLFAREQLFYGLYEDFFCDTEVARLCKFLGIEQVSGQFDLRPHADTKARTLPESAAEVRELYAGTYAFCRARFGAERIDALWTA